MNYYIGIDIGTTATKAIAFSDTGTIITSQSIGYEMLHPQPDWCEQDPDAILQAVVDGLAQVMKTMAPHTPAFIAFSAAMHSLLAVDKVGKPLSNCIIWADNRADQLATVLRNSKTGEGIYQLTGVPIHCMSPLCKLLWLKEQAPLLFQSAYKFIGIKEYVFFKLFGTFVIDTSVASATGLLNSKSLLWDQQVLDVVGITTVQLSQVVPVKHTIYYQSNGGQNLLPPGTPVVVGGSDGALSNLGSGATGAHQMAITIGTSGAARMVVKEPQTDECMRTFCYHVKDREYIVGGANNNGAVVLQWLKETLLQTKDDYESLFKQAETIMPGSDDLLFLPYILGERAPIWNANAKGIYFGLRIRHSKAHLVRASMEGVIYCLYSIGKILIEKHEVTELHASGGFARSRLWLQMLADVFNIKVLVSGTVESSALGAVVIGMEALAIKQHFSPDILAVYEPDPGSHKVYMECFERFERIYHLLEGEQ